MPSFEEGLRPDELPLLMLGLIEFRSEGPDDDARVVLDVEVRNGGSAPVPDVVVAALASAETIASGKVDIAAGTIGHTRLAWPAAAGPRRVTVVIDPDHRLAMESRTECSRTLAVTSDAPVQRWPRNRNEYGLREPSCRNANVVWGISGSH